MRDFLHALFFFNEHQQLLAAKADINNLRDFAQKIASLVRSPIDGEEWRNKFVQLDRDYAQAMKDNAELQHELHVARRQILRLLSPQCCGGDDCSECPQCCGVDDCSECPR